MSIEDDALLEWVNTYSQIRYKTIKSLWDGIRIGEILNTIISTPIAIDESKNIQKDIVKKTLNFKNIYKGIEELSPKLIKKPIQLDNINEISIKGNEETIKTILLILLVSSLKCPNSDFHQTQLGGISKRSQQHLILLINSFSDRVYKERNIKYARSESSSETETGTSKKLNSESEEEFENTTKDGKPILSFNTKSQNGLEFNYQNFEKLQLTNNKINSKYNTQLFLASQLEKKLEQLENKTKETAITNLINDKTVKELEIKNKNLNLKIQDFEKDKSKIKNDYNFQITQLMKNQNLKIMELKNEIKEKDSAIELKKYSLFVEKLKTLIMNLKKKSDNNNDNDNDNDNGNGNGNGNGNENENGLASEEENEREELIFLLNETYDQCKELLSEKKTKNYEEKIIKKTKELLTEMNGKFKNEKQKLKQSNDQLREELERVKDELKQSKLEDLKKIKNLEIKFTEANLQKEKFNTKIQLLKNRQSSLGQVEFQELLDLRRTTKNIELRNTSLLEQNTMLQERLEKTQYKLEGQKSGNQKEMDSIQDQFKEKNKELHSENEKLKKKLAKIKEEKNQAFIVLKKLRGITQEYNSLKEKVKVLEQKNSKLQSSSNQEMTQDSKNQIKMELKKLKISYGKEILNLKKII